MYPGRGSLVCREAYPAKKGKNKTDYVKIDDRFSVGCKKANGIM